MVIHDSHHATTSLVLPDQVWALTPRPGVGTNSRLGVGTKGCNTKSRELPGPVWALTPGLVWALTPGPVWVLKLHKAPIFFI